MLNNQCENYNAKLAPLNSKRIVSKVMGNCLYELYTQRKKDY